MKNYMNKYKSWLQENPNIINDAIESETIKSFKKKTKKTDKGIKCPKC